MTDMTVRFADGDNDVVAIHGFLCVMMGPLLPADIDPHNSATEVWRVVNHECALVALRDGKIVGSIGLVKAPFWWAKDEFFLANRWFAALPDTGAGEPLLHEATAFAKSLGLELQIYDEKRGRIKILNRDPRRCDHNPLLVGPHLDLTAPANTTLQ